MMIGFFEEGGNAVSGKNAVKLSRHHQAKSVLLFRFVPSVASCRVIRVPLQIEAAPNPQPEIRNPMTAEHQRLADSEARKADWKNWGPDVSERAWGTVREDYSATGKVWEYFSHEHARSRAFRWNEDGVVKGVGAG